MQRRTLLIGGLAAAATASTAGPVLFGGTPAGAVPPHLPAAPVAPTLTDVPLRAAAARSSGPQVLAETGTRFSAVALSWLAAGSTGTPTATMRYRSLSGAWSAYQALERDDAEANRGTRDGTSLVWTGPADAVEVRVQGAAGLVDAKLTLIDPGVSAADAPAGPVTSPVRPDLVQPGEPVAPGDKVYPGYELAPATYNRARWGADPKLMNWDPEYSASIKAVVVHHTDTTNSYTAGQVPAIIRSIYAFHSVTRDWGDIGYNFVVDKWGRIFEGRYGGMAEPLIGGHAGGFNRFTSGIAMLGNFSSTRVPGAMGESVARVAAWKLARYYRDPHASTQLTSAGGGTARWPAGTVRNFPTVMGHRNTGFTACPGDYGYATLPALRNRIAVLLR